MTFTTMSIILNLNPKFIYLFVLTTLFLCWFFRNPYRVVSSTGLILSPADGKVIRIRKHATPPHGYEDLDIAWQQVSIFMRVTDVHINRIPISGKVTRHICKDGRFRYAAAHQSDLHNQRVSILIEGECKVICQQVAGMLARRIVCKPQVDDHVHKGAVYGMIQIGSRADLFIPNHLELKVKLGDRLYAGTSIIA